MSTNVISWKGRIIGGLIGFLFGGVGFFIGFALGYFLYDKPRNEMVQRHTQARNAFTGTNINPYARERLIKTTYRLMGYVSRGAGRINQSHINQAEYFMKVMQLDDGMRSLAIESFNLGKKDHFDLYREAQKLYSVFGNSSSTIVSYLMEIQVSIAMADQVIEDGEHKRLLEVAQAFGIPLNHMEQLIRVRIAEMQFANFSREYAKARQSHYQSQGNQGSYSSYGNHSYENYEKYGYDQDESRSSSSDSYSYKSHSSSDLDNAYQILGVTKDTSWEDIRRAHKKLMLKYHPDRLASQGLPPEMVSMYTQKAQDIQAAFALIKRHLGKK